MTSQHLYTLRLENFEGPLDFLLYLVQKNEIDLYEVSLKQIVAQFLEHLIKRISSTGLAPSVDPAIDPVIDQGAEFIQIAATLQLLKSRMLLPRQKTEELLIDSPELDLQFNVIHQLLDYCRFKEAAKSLSELEIQQGGFYSRGSDESEESPKPLGIDHVSLQDLAQLFQSLLSKAKPNVHLIKEELWRVSDKIQFLRRILKELNAIPFDQVFSLESSRDELIATFLALLEVMKLGEAVVVKDGQSILIKGV